MIGRGASGLCAALLAFTTWLQVNDPDPLRWGLFYGLGALLAALGAAGRLWWKHAAAYALLAVGVGLTHVVAGRAALGSGWIDSETLREGFGALIAAAMLAGLAAWRRRVDPDGRPAWLDRRADA